MAAPKGNQFWKARTTHGRPRLYDPATLWEACCEYFQWVENNPLWEVKAWHSNGEVVTKELPKMRPMTQSGLCLFLDISQETWNQYRQQNDLSEVCTKVDQIIYNQKFAGATADLMNPSIIARDLGLKDEKRISGDPDNPIKHDHSIVFEGVGANTDSGKG